MPRQPKNTSETEAEKGVRFATIFPEDLHKDLTALCKARNLSLKQFVEFNLRQDVADFKANTRVLKILTPPAT